MLNWEEKKYAEFGKKFLEFYIENGFGNKTKTDIDAKIFSLIIDEIDSNTKLLALKLGMTPRKFNNLVMQACFRYNNDKDSESRAKKRLLEFLTNTSYGHEKDKKLRFLLSDPILRTYFAAYCQKQKIMTDTSFNRDIVVMSYTDFSRFLELTYEDEVDATKLRIRNNVKGIANIILDTLPGVVQNVSGLTSLRDFSKTTAEYLTDMLLAYKR